MAITQDPKLCPQGDEADFESFAGGATLTEQLDQFFGLDDDTLRSGVEGLKAAIPGQETQAGQRAMQFTVEFVEGLLSKRAELEGGEEEEQEEEQA